MHQRVIAGLHLVLNIRQADFTLDAAEVHQSHRQALVLMNLDNASGNPEAHSFSS